MKAGILQKKTSNNNQADSSLVSSHDTGKDVAFLHESDHQSPSFFSPSSIQPKLTIGQPNDQYEQEADQTADQVLQRLADTSKHNPEIKAQDNNVNTALVQPKFQPTPLNISRIQRDSSKGENEEERQEEPKEDDQQAIQLKCSDCDTPEDIQTKREQGLSSPDGWRIQKPFSATEVGCRTANNGIAQRKCAQCEGEMEGPGIEEVKIQENTSCGCPILVRRATGRAGEYSIKMRRMRPRKRNYKPRQRTIPRLVRPGKLKINLMPQREPEGLCTGIPDLRWNRLSAAILAELGSILITRPFK